MMRQYAACVAPCDAPPACLRYTPAVATGAGGHAAALCIAFCPAGGSAGGVVSTGDLQQHSRCSSSPSFSGAVAHTRRTAASAGHDTAAV
jgi:hypothetical protein